MSNDEKPQLMAILDAELFWRAGFCMSTEETRYYITGTRVEPEPNKGGACMVSTNGHALVAIRDPNAIIHGDGIVSLSASMSAALRALVGKRAAKKRSHSGVRTLRTERLTPNSKIRLVINGKKAALIETDDEPLNEYKIEELFGKLDAPDVSVRSMQWSELLIDGTFPDWRRVIPGEPKHDCQLGVFNQTVIKPVIDALSDGESRAARFIPIGEMGPAIVRTASREIDGFGVVMPMRSDAPDTLPDWFVVKKPEPVKVEEPAAPAVQTEIEKADAKVADMTEARAKSRKRPPARNRGRSVSKPLTKSPTKKAMKKKARRRA